MKKMILTVCGFLILAAAGSGVAPALAGPTLVLKPEQTRSQATPIAEELQKQLQSLVGAAPVAAPVNNEVDDSNVEPMPTFGTRALNFVIQVADIVKSQAQGFIENIDALPQLSDWLTQQQIDPKLHARWGVIGQDLTSYVLVPLFGAILLEMLFFPLRLSLRRRHPGRWAGRLAVVLGLFILRAIPVLVFIGFAANLLDQNETQKLPRFVLFNIVYAFTLIRIVISVLRGVFAPGIAALRIVPMTSEQAVYCYQWLRAFTIVIACSYFFHDIAVAIHIPASTIVALGNISGLALVAMMIVVIIQKRSFVATLLRGDLPAAQPPVSPFQALRLWFARRWHIIAITYLVIGYVIAAMGVANGLVIMIRGTILTFLVLVAVRLGLGLVDQWVVAAERDKASLRVAVFSVLFRILIWVFALMGFAASWGVDMPALFATPIGQHILGSLFSISLTVIGLTTFYEILSSAIDRHMSRRSEDTDVLRASARIRTLLPMIRNVLFVLFAAVFGIVLLSELGINVAPLLAGAGILGVAVGFGSQTLVKDFLTGFFIIIENTIAIGDYIRIGDQAGFVESISLRTVRLRDYDGALHIVPFSEVTKITNATKDFGYAMISVGVAYDTDLDHALKVMREVSDDLQSDPQYARLMLRPIEIWGVDKLGDSAITLMGRIRTRAGNNSDVRRAYLLRLKKRFDKEKIEIPYPTVTHIQRTDVS